MNNLLLKMYVKLRCLAIQEDGQDLVEYALIIGMIAVGALAALKGLDGAIIDKFGTIATDITNAGS